MGNTTEHASTSDTVRGTAYSDEEIPQKLEEEKCSIDDEVVLLREIRNCVHQAQVGLRFFDVTIKPTLILKISCPIGLIYIPTFIRIISIYRMT